MCFIGKKDLGNRSVFIPVCIGRWLSQSLIVSPVFLQSMGQSLVNECELPLCLGLTGKLGCHTSPHSAFKNSFPC